jgi:hypothetical protein
MVDSKLRVRYTTPPRITTSAVTAVLVITVSLPGCRRSGDYTAKVHGTVTLDGRPLTTGAITSTPLNGGRGATAQIQSDGTFTLTAIGEDGVAPGTHRVTVTAWERDEHLNSDPESERKFITPIRYSDPGRSGITIDVVPGEENRINLKLTSKGS